MTLPFQLSEDLVLRVYSYLLGVELSRVRVACVPGEEIRAAARSRFEASFGWLWPPGAPFGGSWSRAVAALESRRSGCFMMVGGTRQDSEPLAGASYVRIENGLRRVFDLPSPRVYRNAVAAVRDARGGVVLAGGWDGRAPLRSVERFDGANWRYEPDMRRPRCFAAAGRWGDAVLVAGGADTLWVMSAVTAETEVVGSDLGPPMLAARCGHGAATTSDGRVVVAGGYGGGSTYFRSCEVLGFDDCWTPLPRMGHVRTGAPLAFGPDNAVYVVGGSPDGSDALASCERIDLRTNRWHVLPPMATPRSYLAAAFGASGDLVAQGGYDRDGDTLATAETFDLRKHEWRTHDEPIVVGDDGDVASLARAQNALIFALLPPDARHMEL